MHVFPGGAVEPDDIRLADELVAARAELAALPFAARPAASAGGHLGEPIAAVRETLEETSHDLGDPLNLGYVGHWVTPAVEDRRFDTRFYAAVVSEDHHVRENSGESDADRWLRPADALAESAAGNMLMLPPTVASLADFAALAAQGATAQEAIDELASRTIIPLMPSPTADPTDPSGVRAGDWWTSERTKRSSKSLDRPQVPESGGIHTSLDGILAWESAGISNIRWNRLLEAPIRPNASVRRREIAS